MITRLITAITILAGLFTLPAQAAELTLPSGARLLSNRQLDQDSYALPLSAFVGEAITSRRFEGRVERLSWRLTEGGATTLQLLEPLREQLVASGYSVIFECRDMACGGFDFRFGIEVIPAPDMHVNIRDYRFLSATTGTEEAVSLLISRLGKASFIQMIHASPRLSEPLAIAPVSPVTNVVQQPDGTSTQALGLADTLQARGRVILSDLDFETGAARLGQGPFGSLKKLAEYLKANPGQRIALVGHTDSVGSLSGNIALSKRRAGLVQTRLSKKYGIALSRIDAEGMGYLAPIASNLTQDGREANRRVEAILLSK